jgi:hypothetical protein
MKLYLGVIGLACLTATALLAAPPQAAPPPAPAASPAATTATATGEQLIQFDDQPVGAPPANFEPVIGDWYVSEAGGQKGLLVDGSKWRQGTPSANLADQAKRLYGDRYAEFLDGVKAFAFFPLAIYKGECAGDDLTLSMRFYPQAGRIDQGAGIAWSIAKDGSYWGARANALENNILFFKVVRGKRTVIQNVRGTPTATKTWHTFQVHLAGKSLTVQLDGKEVLRRELEAPHSGRCGLWSKADSQVLFDDFRISHGSAK